MFKTLQSYKKHLTYANFSAIKCNLFAFFDYSLWNHYVKGHLFVFLVLNNSALYFFCFFNIYTYTKKRDLLYSVPLYIFANKKRDCIIAVPLSEALALPSIPNNNTVAHAVCIYVRMRVPSIHTNGHLVSRCFGIC